VADHLQEEEQLDAIKQWWQENRTSIMGAVVLALGGSFGWSQYQDYTAESAIAAADAYDAILIERDRFVTITARSHSLSLPRFKPRQRQLRRGSLS